MLFLEPAKFAGAFAHVADDGERAQMMGALANDFHAGFFETSMALHYAPESVAPDYTSLPPCPDVRPDGKMALAARMARALGRDQLSRELTFAAEGIGWNALRPFPGYTGRPHRATPQAGAVFAAEIVRRYVAGIEDVFAGRAESPPPIMRWVGALSLGGRIGNLPVPSMAEMK